MSGESICYAAHCNYFNSFTSAYARCIFKTHEGVCVCVCFHKCRYVSTRIYLIPVYLFGLVLEAVMSLSLNETDVGIRLNKGNNL